MPAGPRAEDGAPAASTEGFAWTPRFPEPPKSWERSGSLGGGSLGGGSLGGGSLGGGSLGAPRAAPAGAAVEGPTSSGLRSTGTTQGSAEAKPPDPPPRRTRSGGPGPAGGEEGVDAVGREVDHDPGVTPSSLGLGRTDEKAAAPLSKGGGAGSRLRHGGMHGGSRASSDGAMAQQLSVAPPPELADVLLRFASKVLCGFCMRETTDS